jgi:hypothetical protein
MTQIYRQAFTVVVWLGLKTPGVEQAFNFASEIAQLQRRLHNAPREGRRRDGIIPRLFLR